MFKIIIVCLQHRHVVSAYEADWCLKVYQSDSHPFVVRSLLLVNGKCSGHGHNWVWMPQVEAAEIERGTKAQGYLAGELKFTGLWWRAQRGKKSPQRWTAPTSTSSLSHDFFQRMANLKVTGTEERVNKTDPALKIIQLHQRWDTTHNFQGDAWGKMQRCASLCSKNLNVKRTSLNCWSGDQKLNFWFSQKFPNHFIRRSRYNF